MPAKRDSNSPHPKPTGKTAPLAAMAQAKTVKISRPSNDNQAVVVRKGPRAATTLPVLPLSERAKLVAEAAYFLAEKRGFDPAEAASDWYEAERLVDGSYRFT